MWGLGSWPLILGRGVGGGGPGGNPGARAARTDTAGVDRIKVGYYRPRQNQSRVLPGHPRYDRPLLPVAKSLKVQPLAPPMVSTRGFPAPPTTGCTVHPGTKLRPSLTRGPSLAYQATMSTHLLRRIERERTLLDRIARCENYRWGVVERARVLLDYQEVQDADTVSANFSLPLSWVQRVLEEFERDGASGWVLEVASPLALEAKVNGLPVQAEALAPIPPGWEEEVLYQLRRGVPSEIAAQSAGVDLALALSNPRIAQEAKIMEARTAGDLFVAMQSRARGLKSKRSRKEVGTCAGKPHDLAIEEETELPPSPQAAKVILEHRGQIQPEVKITITGLPMDPSRALELVRQRTGREPIPRQKGSISE